MKQGRKKGPAKEGQEPPAWIVSFTDMITLLLAFFVLLQTFSSMQDPELFFVGRDAFRRAIAGLGIPGLLLGKQQRPKFVYRKPKHSTEEAEHKIPKNRALDVEDEKIRQAFATMREAMTTESPEITSRLLEKRVPPIDFAPMRSELTAPAKSHLTDYAVDLQQNLQDRRITIHIIGFASDVKPLKEKYLVSAARAKAVEDFLRSACGDAAQHRGWRFVSWGAGAGGQWRQDLGRIPEQSDIAIVVTEER